MERTKLKYKPLEISVRFFRGVSYILLNPALSKETRKPLIGEGMRQPKHEVND